MYSHGLTGDCGSTDLDAARTGCSAVLDASRDWMQCTVRYQLQYQTGCNTGRSTWTALNAVTAFGRTMDTGLLRATSPLRVRQWRSFWLLTGSSAVRAWSGLAQRLRQPALPRRARETNKTAPSSRPRPGPAGGPITIADYLPSVPLPRWKSSRGEASLKDALCTAFYIVLHRT